jgi:hypothetical protein
MTVVMRLLDEFRHLKEPVVYKGVWQGGNAEKRNCLEAVPKWEEAALAELRAGTG